MSGALGLPPLSRFLLLAAVPAALAVFLVLDARPASADHENAVAWSATLTQPTIPDPPYLGCRNTTSGIECTSTSVLTDDDFTYDGVDYAITQVGIGNSVTSVVFDKAIPEAFQSGATLWINDTPLHFEEASISSGDTTAAWGVFGDLNWEAGDEVSFAIHAPPPPVWSAQLTPGGDTRPTDFWFAIGCSTPSSHLPACSSALTDHTFVLGGTTYTINNLYHQERRSNGRLDSLYLSLGTAIPEQLKSFTLEVGDNSFPLSAATIGVSVITISLSDDSSLFVVDRPVTLRLIAPPPPTGVETSLETLAVTEGGSATFTVALSEDPGASTTVHLVKAGYGQPGVGRPGHVWDPGAATFSPATLTFTSSDYSDAQTVTVTAPQDLDDRDEQLAILVLSTVRKQVFTYVGAGNGWYDLDLNAGTYTYVGRNMGSYNGSYQNVPARVVGDSGNTVGGVHVTVTDDDDSAVVPTNLQGLPGHMARRSHPWLVRFSWDAPSGQTVSGYDFQWKREAAYWQPVSTAVSGTSVVVQLDRDNNEVVDWRVRARTGAGVTDWATSSVTLANPVNLVRDLNKTEGDGELALTWNPPADWPVAADGYDVRYRQSGADDQDANDSRDPSKGWVDARHTGKETGHTIENLTNGTNYQVQVRLQSVYHFAWQTVWGTPRSTAPAQGQGVPQARQSSPTDEYAGLIADIKLWRDDPCCVHNQNHTDRWDRVLARFGEAVSDQTLEPMTANEAQTYADRGWTRWTRVVTALRAIEAAASASVGDSTQPPAAGDSAQDPGASPGDAPTSQGDSFFDPPPGDAPTSAAESGPPDGQPANRAPTVAAALADLSGLEAGTTRAVPLAGVFSDPDNDSLTITAASSDEAVATVEVAADSSSLTLTAVGEGTATITVTADDADGERASDTFDVTVTAAPPQESTLTGAAARYDTNSDGAIDVTEYGQAVYDYAARKITYSELLEVVTAYQAS